MTRRTTTGNARYDADGYRSDGKRQILGYSHRWQGGAAEARARADAKRNAHYRPTIGTLPKKGDEFAQFRNQDGTPKVDRGVTVPGANGSSKIVMPKSEGSLPAYLKRPQAQVAKDRVDAIAPPASYLGPLNRMIDEAKGKVRRRADGTMESLLLKRPAVKAPPGVGKRYV